MPLEPKIPKKAFQGKQCPKCQSYLSIEDFSVSHSIFYSDGRLPICNGCINEFLKSKDYEWVWIDKVCQWADIPWIVKEWVRLEELNGRENTWPVYAKVFADRCYESLGWSDYNKQYKELRERGMIEEELPLIHEQHIAELHRKWGANYDEDELYYLEDLFQGLLTSQNVNGALQTDQAQKICKFSLEIDSRIRAGDEKVDKFITSYDRLVKVAEFTPKNTKNAVDFDSFAEVGHWLEKRGHQNKFYDGTTRDVIDETLKNIENYNQRLYINEGGIGDEITQRLNALHKIDGDNHDTSLFDLETEHDLDEYDNDGFIMKEEEEFIVEDEGDE